MPAFAMQAISTLPRRDDGHLWVIALGVSLCANLLLLVLGGLAAIEINERREQSPSTSAKPRQQETVAIIQAVPADETTVPPESARKSFARTSPEQAAEPLRDPAFIGERDTRATSDRAPVADAPPLPSQAGIEPRDKTDIETTESDYQDGELVQENITQPNSQSTPPPAPLVKPLPPGDTVAAAAPPREKLLEGPNPVDVPVQRAITPADEIKPAPEQNAAAESPPPTIVPEENKDTADTPPAETTPKPAFRGYQRKTAIVGSITRNGRSSLDVEDSPLGRYQAAISRAVELEWQRNCVRHRDFITPGFLTVRFFVENNGRVRSVQFVGDMETGEVQKGFTLNSIRDAAIPPMTGDLKQEFKDEPLELVFRFYF